MAIGATQYTSGDIFSNVNTSNGGGASNVGQMQDRFLKLLVTQLQHQDPMNPMENAELTTQLAQMSTVEGINNMNANLQALLAGYQASQTMQAAAMLGHKVLAEGDVLTLSDGAAGGGFELPEDATSVKVLIRDEDGNLVRTLTMGELDEGLVRFGWDGKDDAGNVLEDGYYTYEVSALAADDGATLDPTQYALTQVVSVSMNGSEMTLETDTLGELGFDQIRQIF